MKVLVVMKVLDEHRKMLEEVDPGVIIKYAGPGDADASDLADADMIVGNIEPKLLEKCKKLKLLQLNTAGTDGYTDGRILPEGAVLANATGAYGLAISEHMIASLLCLMKKLDLYRLNQVEKVWKDHGPVTSIYGSKTLIVGFGDIGSEFGIRMNALGSSVAAIRKKIGTKPDYVESVHTMDDFHKCLEEADIVAATLPGYAETYNVFDGKAFDAMKPGAFFLNAGRGNAVDTEALCDALEKGKLSGAALDVTNPEPLPRDHRLWDMPNLLITPHVSGGFHLKATHDRIVKIAAVNIAHLVKGENFENIVDMTTGYRINH